jgi:hypothetical protein
VTTWITSAGFLLLLFALIVFLMWISLRAWRALGKSKAEAIAAKKAVDQAKRAKEIGDEVKRMSDDDLDKRL